MCRSALPSFPKSSACSRVICLLFSNIAVPRLRLSAIAILLCFVVMPLLLYLDAAMLRPHVSALVPVSSRSVELARPRAYSRSSLLWSLERTRPGQRPPTDRDALQYIAPCWRQCAALTAQSAGAVPAAAPAKPA